MVVQIHNTILYLHTCNTFRVRLVVTTIKLSVTTTKKIMITLRKRKRTHWKWQLLLIQLLNLKCVHRLLYGCISSIKTPTLLFILYNGV